ncbi:MAG: DUF748 domain-containing protein [Sulfurimonas sp.]|nr:DUF748 domain-containing protein [Sulfurimonas sp.]
MFKKIVLSFLVLYILFGFFVLPLIVKSQVIKIVEQKTNAKLFINDVYFNPFIFNLELSGIKLKDLNNEHLASLKSLEIDVELYSLLRAAIHVNSIVIDKPKISVVYNKDKTLNFSTLLKTEENKSVDEVEKEETQIPRVIVDVIKISDGGVDYEDFTNSKKFDFSLRSIGFELRDIDTNDFNSSDANLRFYSNLEDGGFVDFRSEIVGFKPFKLQGSIKFEASKLYTQWRYIQDMIGFEVANGKLSFGADYHLNVDDLNSTAIENLHVSLENLRIKPKTKDHDILNMKALHVGGVTIKPMQQDVHVEFIRLNSLDAKVLRDEQGEIDWLGYLKDPRVGNEKEKTQSVEVQKADSNTTPWSVALDNISLEKISLTVDDASVKPNVKTSLNELNINLKDVTLAGEKPFLYEMDLMLNDNFKCTSNGDVKHKNIVLNTYLTCQGFDLIHYKPYIDQIASNELKTYNLELKNAIANFDVNATLKDENSTINAFVKRANFSLDKFVLNRKDTDEKLVDFKNFNINGVRVDTKIKDVNIEKIALNNLGVYAKKNKNGAINLEGLVEAKEMAKTENISKKSETAQEEKSYRVKLKHFDVNSAKLAFKDDSLQSVATSKIDKININAYDIDSNEKSWLKYDMSLRVNEKGSVSSKGSVRHTPLKQKGSISLNRISLKEITPYLGESLFVQIDDGYLSLESKLEYNKDDKKADLFVNGGLKIEKFKLSDSRSHTPLITFAKTELKTFNFEMFPNSLYIDTVELDKFYVDAQIDEKKQMNFAKLSKLKDDSNLTKTEDANASKTSKEEKFPMKIMRLHVTNGKANFADYSLPIRFKTSIHDLNGDIYAISTKKGEVSYIDIDGEVDEYGSTKLKGSIEVSDIKSFTDIGFSFKNLSLDSYSGYSAQFAGYKIDKGKLFLDLNYKIHDSELLGENSLVIKSIELGDEIEDENITKLPLGFAIALLEDSDGVIDIDMPVEGNLDAPDFKYGALVLKTFANLIIKAVASPFNFLGAAMGINGDDLKYAEFDASEHSILPPEKEKLDNIVKILLKKPRLALAIAPSYNKELDKKAIQAKKLQLQVLKKSDGKGVATIDILEDIYEKSVGEKALDALEKEFEKRYTKDEIFKIEYTKELLARCRDIQTVSIDELKALATTRAAKLQEYLVLTKNIDSSRVVMHEIEELEEDDGIKTELKIIVK